MNGQHEGTNGISSGRQWSALPVNGEPLEWSIDAKQGHVQGPLDLEFLRGQKLVITLDPGQQALLVQGDELKAVFLDGTHYLDIGKGSRQIDPACQIIFLALDKPLHMRWTSSHPLQVGTGEQRAVIGNCVLRVEAPGRFFATFLAGHPRPEADFTVRLIERLLQETLSTYLSGGFAGDPDNDGCFSESEIQARLTRLSPEDINDDLGPCGLRCTHLALYTSAPPIEDAMAWSATGNNATTY